MGGMWFYFFFFQAEDGIRDVAVTGVQTCALPIFRSTAEGLTDLEHLRELCAHGDVAGLMLTNPNTLGLFERNIQEICLIVHDAGGLVYMDGANMNALVGIARPGDM